MGYISHIAGARILETYHGVFFYQKVSFSVTTLSFLALLKCKHSSFCLRVGVLSISDVRRSKGGCLKDDPSHEICFHALWGAGYIDWSALLMDAETFQLPVVYCTVLYYTTLHFTSLYCIVFYYTTLHYTSLYCMYCIVLHFTVLYCTLLHFTVVYCTILYCIVIPQLPLRRR